jgi:hypothetical protein
MKRTRMRISCKEEYDYDGGREVVEDDKVKWEDRKVTWI